MKKRNKFHIEFLIAAIIVIILIITLFFETFSEIIPKYAVVSLFFIFIVFKIIHIIKVRGTIFEDYISLFIIVLLGFLRFITVNSKIHIAVLSISLLILLYSVGLIPTTKKLAQSKSLTSFVFSYIFFIVAVIILFAGSYSTNNDLFLEKGMQTSLNFKDAMYFSTMTFTTVGYGDIAPLGINKLISSIEAIAGIVLNIGFIGYILASKRFK